MIFSMSRIKRVAFVTGGNKGIGFEVCRQLAKAGLQVILTARDQKKGEAAVRMLSVENLDVHFLHLDVTNQSSINFAAQTALKEFHRVDVLVNNAGVMIDPPRHPPDVEGASALTASVDTIRNSLEANTLGGFQLCQKLIPFMIKNKYGRIVNVSSGMGQLSEMNGGWPGYRISKVAVNAVTRIFADEVGKDSNILVNSVCPGWVKTDMGGTEAERTPAQGAETITWLATLPDGGPTGGFFRDKQPIGW